MMASPHFKRIRTLEREAAARLEAQGYVVLQFKDQEAPGHLFATRDDHGLFITLMRAHDPFSGIEEVTKCYGGIIRHLRNFPRPEDYHFEIWVFVFSTGRWQYYRIGHDEVTEVDHGG
jgi:hypothetical protein